MHRCTGVWPPNTSRTALRSAWAPSRTTSTPWSTSRPRPVRLASSVVATVAFSVDPSHSPSGCLTPSVSIPNATTQQRPLELDPVEHHHRQAQIAQRPRHEIDQVLARARHELARHGRLRRRPGDVVDIGADRLTGPGVAARRDAGQHPLEHHVGEVVTRGEVLVGLQLDLAGAVSGPGSRAADGHAPPSERDLAVFVTVPDRGAVRDVAALRAHDPIDLGLHDLVQHPKPDADTEREQALLRRAVQLTQPVLHSLRQPLDAAHADDLVGVVIYG